MLLPRLSGRVKAGQLATDSLPASQIRLPLSDLKCGSLAYIEHLSLRPYLKEMLGFRPRHDYLPLSKLVRLLGICGDLKVSPVVLMYDKRSFLPYKIDSFLF